MVAPLPEFKESVQVQPVALPDRQAALSSLGDKLSSFGLGVAKVVASKDKLNLDAEKAAAQIQGRDGISRIRERVLDPNNFSDGATNSYDAQVSGLTKGILNNSDPKIKPFLSNMLSYYGDKNRDVVTTKVNALKKNQLVGGLQEYNTKTTDDAINAKLSDEVIPDPEDETKSLSKGDVLIGRVNQANNSAMNRGLITPKEAFAYKEAAHQSYAEADYLHQFQKVLANKNQSPQKWVESLGKNKTITPATKQKVQAQTLSMMNQAKQSNDTNTALIHQQTDDTLRQVSSGTLDINSPHVSDVKLRNQALGADGKQDFEHRLTAASVFSVTKNSMKFVPFMQSKSLLKQMEPASDDPGFKYKNKINSALESQINANETLFKKDPFGYVSDNPDVTNAFEARMTAANDGVTKVQPAQLQTIDPLAVALDKEKMMGANDQQLSVMKNDQAANIVSAVEGQPDPVQQLQLVNDVYDSYGKYKTIAARDLSRAGMPENIMALAGLQNISKSKPFIQGMLLSFQQSKEIQDRLKEGGQTKEQFTNFKSSATSDLQNILDTYGNTTDSEAFKSSMVNAVAIGAAGYYLQHNGTIAASKCSTRIADAMFRNRYSGILESNVRVPINVPISNAKDALYAKEKDLPNVPFLPLKRPAEGDETKIMRILQNNSDKNFVQRILKPEGKPTLDLGGKEFATHKMSWATTDGKPIVYPKVIQDAKTGKLKELSAKDALNHAIKTKQFITAKDNDEAEWFSSNYKKVWNIDGKNITLKKGVPSGLSPGETLQADQDAIKAGHWKTMSDESGAYWVDHSGFTPQYIKAGTQTRYEVHWKDLQDKTSDLHGLIASHKRKAVGLF